jgi:DNA polymerase III subunit alpha
MKDFVHLHLHTKFSLQDGTTEPEGLMKKCADHGMKSVGVTDHGNMAGMWDCAKYAKQYGINLIPGNEFYVVPDAQKSRGNDWRKGKSSHLGLLAYSQTGWDNLLRLTALSNLEGFYNEPRIDYRMLRENSEGLWCMSGCLGGFINTAIKNNQSPRFAVDMLHSIFGDRLSLEIQVNPIPDQQILNDEVIAIHHATKIPLVATVDAHYLDKTDSHNQDILFAMQLGKSLEDPERLKMPPEEHSVETPEEAIKRFTDKYGNLGLEACRRTVEIGDNSHSEITYQSKSYKIPTLDVAAQPDFQEFLKWKTGCECHTSDKGECLVHGKACGHNH